MNQDLENQLKRDARTAEHEVPQRVLAGLHARLAVEGAPERALASGRGRNLLVAAALLVAAGGLFWALNAQRPDEGKSGDPSSQALATQSGNGLQGQTRIELPRPSQTLALAARASEPLEREWEHMKNDSKALLLGFERQIPRLTSRE